MSNQLEKTREHSAFQINKERIIEHLVGELRSGRLGVVAGRLNKEVWQFATANLNMSSKDIETALRRKCVRTAVMLYAEESKTGKRIAEGFVKRRKDAAKEQLASAMRSQATPSEHAMRLLLDREFRDYGFRSQVVLFGFIADFYSSRVNVVIEVDGSSHDGRAEYDKNRDAALAGKGIRTIRISSDDVLRNGEVVVAAIRQQLPILLPSVQNPAKVIPLKYNGRGKRPVYVQSDGKVRIFNVHHPMYSGKVTTKGKKIKSTPPIWKWSVGMKFNALLVWLEKKGAIPEVVLECEPPKTLAYAGSSAKKQLL